MRYSGCYLLFSSILLLVQTGCGSDMTNPISNCGGDMKIIGDQFLNLEETGQITHFDYPETIVFRNSEGDFFPFSKISNNISFKQKTSSFMGECNSGVPFSPYYNREVFILEYASDSSNDTISIVVKAFTSLAITDEDQLMPDNNTQINRADFTVKLSFGGCEAVETSQFLSSSNGESYINTSPFTVSKFGQSYADLYGVRRTWSNNVWFSFSNGIVAFDYCGKDYAQVVN